MTNHLKIALAEINHYYGDKRAKRSGVPLINHINEGIAILQAINCSEEIQAAFALHPITQNEDLKTYKWKFDHLVIVISLAKDYTEAANSYLCRPETDHIKNTVDLNLHFNRIFSEEVLKMLYADKIQNRKDFELYHLDTHERSDKLKEYFNIWIDYIQRNLK